MARQCNRQKQLMVELVNKALCTHAMLYSNKPKPGDMIINLPVDKRKILEGLTADDISNVRPIESF